MGRNALTAAVDCLVSRRGEDERATSRRGLALPVERNGPGAINKAMTINKAMAALAVAALLAHSPADAADDGADFDDLARQAKKSGLFGGDSVRTGGRSRTPRWVATPLGRQQGKAGLGARRV